jgi:hypothetical protein
MRTSCSSPFTFNNKMHLKPAAHLQLCKGISSAAPALALLTTGVSGAQFLLQPSTPMAPRQYAERSMAPRFCCSEETTKCERQR